MKREHALLAVAAVLGLGLGALALRPPDTQVAPAAPAPVPWSTPAAPGTLLPPPDPLTTRPVAPSSPVPTAPAPEPVPVVPEPPPVAPEDLLPLDGDGAQAAIDATLPLLDACLDGLPVRSVPVPGKLTATVHIVTDGAIGRVKRIDIAHVVPEDGGLLTCMHHALRQATFAPPPQGKLDLTLPLDLRGR